MSAVDAWLVAVRAGHILACLLLFGETLYVRRIDPQAPLRVGLMIGAVAIALVCGVAWLCIEAVAMSGESLQVAVLGTVLGATQFGHVWLARSVLLVMLGIAACMPQGRRAALPLAGLQLALLALAGHAGAATGLRRLAEVLVDAVHLLAAGAWLGSLPALAATLASTRSRETIVRVTRRYSQIAYAAATAVVATGIVNARFRNAGPVELVTTDYGRLLLIKLAFVVAMLGLAATNRYRLTPRLAQPDGRALAALRRNAWLEIAFGIVVVAVVGALGITPPPMMGMSHGMH